MLFPGLVAELSFAPVNFEAARAPGTLAGLLAPGKQISYIRTSSNMSIGRLLN